MIKKLSLLTIQKMCEIVGCKEYSYLGDEMFLQLFDKARRETIFRQFLDVERDLSKDWFTSYFEEHIADRRNLKQDYTPHAITELISTVVGAGNSTMEVAAGTGVIILKKWNTDRLAVSPFEYRPSNYIYWIEEYSKKNIPFLLFNCLIRGMNAVVIHCDTLERIAEQVYFVCNDTDDYMKFSSLNVMPRSKNCEEYFDIRGWIGEPITHLESPNWFESIC